MGSWLKNSHLISKEAIEDPKNVKKTNENVKKTKTTCLTVDEKKNVFLFHRIFFNIQLQYRAKNRKQQKNSPLVALTAPKQA